MPKDIKYPRRVMIRQALRILARVLMPLLADVRITGRENFPDKGPLLVVGNHTAAMEAGIRELYNLAFWAKEKGLSLKVTPIRRFKEIATGREIVLDRPEEFVKW